jgi:hypothetical protein
MSNHAALIIPRQSKMPPSFGLQTRFQDTHQAQWIPEPNLAQNEAKERNFYWVYRDWTGGRECSDPYIATYKSRLGALTSTAPH